MIESELPFDLRADDRSDWGIFESGDNNPLIKVNGLFSLTDMFRCGVAAGVMTQSFPSRCAVFIPKNLEDLREKDRQLV